MLEAFGYLFAFGGAITICLGIFMFVTHTALKITAGVAMFFLGCIMLAISTQGANEDYIQRCKDAGGFTIEDHTMCVQKIELPAN